MLSTQKRLYVLLMFILFPVTPYAQIPLYELPVEKAGFGLEFSALQDVNVIGTRVDYAIDKYSKLAFNAGIGFNNDKNDLESFDEHTPPSPSGGIGIVYIKPLGKSGLKYLLHSGFGAEFAWAVDDETNETLSHSRAFRLSGTSGILKRLETESDWVISPFFAMSYTNVWTTIESTLQDFDETESDGNFGGTIGLEIEMSRTVSAMASFAFSFQSTETVFNIGLNFH